MTMNNINLYLAIFQIILTFLIFFKISVLTKISKESKMVKQEVPIEDSNSLMERYRREVASKRFSRHQ